jgi:hypothetical protein
MSGLMETPSPLPTTVGYEAENEEQSSSPGGAHNAGSPIIAFDWEGGISYVKRLVAPNGSEGPGEGES